MELEFGWKDKWRADKINKKYGKERIRKSLHLYCRNVGDLQKEK
jgi:hypothetical protein